MADKKFLDANGLKLVKEDYKGRIDKVDEAKVDKQDNAGLYPDTDKTKLQGITEGAEPNVITSITFNEQPVTISQKTAQIVADVLASDALDDYLDQDGVAEAITQALTEYAKTSELEALQALLNKVGKYQGPTTKEQLATLKTTANVGDIYTVTDDNNHAYIFCGAEKANQAPVDANGFLDIGGHIDLTSITEQLEDKADKKDLPEALSNQEIQAILNDAE